MSDEKPRIDIDWEALAILCLVGAGAWIMLVALGLSVWTWITG